MLGQVWDVVQDIPTDIPNLPLSWVRDTVRDAVRIAFRIASWEAIPEPIPEPIRIAQTRLNQGDSPQYPPLLSALGAVSQAIPRPQPGQPIPGQARIAYPGIASQEAVLGEGRFKKVGFQTLPFDDIPNITIVMFRSHLVCQLGSHTFVCSFDMPGIMFGDIQTVSTS